MMSSVPEYCPPLNSTDHFITVEYFGTAITIRISHASMYFFAVCTLLTEELYGCSELIIAEPRSAVGNVSGYQIELWPGLTGKLWFLITLIIDKSIVPLTPRRLYREIDCIWVQVSMILVWHWVYSICCIVLCADERGLREYPISFTLHK